jgi:hypothetical protein
LFLALKFFFGWLCELHSRTSALCLFLAIVFSWSEDYENS